MSTIPETNSEPLRVPLSDLLGALRAWLRILCTPSCWLRKYPSCPEMSRFINVALDLGHEPKALSEHWLELDGRRLWASNYPYAYANAKERMPDRRTVFRLSDAAQKAAWKTGA